MEAGASDRREGEGPAGAVKAASDDEKATSFNSGNDDDEGSESEGLLQPHGGDSTSTPNEAQGGGSNDALTRLRKEKRLAMNRESARNRRKRKKMLIESLEAQVAKLKSSNQQYQLTTESMAAKVRGLENDLAVARSTIRQLTGANHPSSLQQQQHHQSQLLQQLQQQQQQPQQQQFGTTDIGATMDADRLRQAQLQQLMFLQGGGGGGGGSGSAGSASFNRHNMPHANPGVAGFSHSEHDTAFIRQQQLLAAQQATSRDRAIMLQSNMSRAGNNAAMSSPNTHPNALLNTVCTQVPRAEVNINDIANPTQNTKTDSSLSFFVLCFFS